MKIQLLFLAITGKSITLYWIFEFGIDKKNKSTCLTIKNLRKYESNFH